MDAGELAALKNRLRAVELGLSRSRGHLVTITWEAERLTWLVERERKLVAEALAQLELAFPAEVRREGSRRSSATGLRAGDRRVPGR